jgi:hypothetical protein
MTIMYTVNLSSLFQALHVLHESDRPLIGVVVMDHTGCSVVLDDAEDHTRACITLPVITDANQMGST